MLPFGREHFGFNDGFAQPSVAGSGPAEPARRGRPAVAGALAPAAAGRDRARLRGRGRPAAARSARAAAPQRDVHGPAQAPPGRRRVADVAARRPPTSGPAATRSGSRRRSSGAGPTARPPRGAPSSSPHLADHRPARDQRVPLRPRPGGAALPGRRAHPARQPARGPGRRLGAHPAAPDHPARHALRRAAAGHADDGAERGLHFACFNASIARQFEVVQDWSVDGNVFGLGPRQPRLPRRRRRGPEQDFVLPGEPPVRLPAARAAVRPRARRRVPLRPVAAAGCARSPPEGAA